MTGLPVCAVSLWKMTWIRVPERGGSDMTSDSKNNAGVNGGKRTALHISLIAISAAIVAVFTIAVRIPVPATSGYISLCDAAVVFVASAFGPFTGLIAGGLGTAAADLAGGYPQFAVISFIVHGLEALLIGLVTKRGSDALAFKVISAVIAIAVVAGGYLLLEVLFLTTFPAALVEVPMNAIQSGAGAVIGLVIYTAVRKAYRNLDSIRW